MRACSLVLVAIAACSANDRVIITAPAGWVSAIVGIDGELTAYTANEPIRATRPEGANVTVIAAFYSATLDQIGVARGPIPHSDSTRPIPTPTLGAFLRTLTFGEVTQTEALALGDERLRRLRVPAIEPPACATSGLCLEVDGANRECVSTCGPVAIAAPAPISAEPAAPAEVAPPEAPHMLPCTGGWIESRGACSPPPLPPRVVCPAGEMQRYGSATCAPIGRPCTGAEWPAPPPGRPVRWVRASGGLGPDGASAFTTIESALAGAPSSAVIALARGRHPGGVEVHGQLILGACARDTVIDAPPLRVAIVVQASGGEIEDLTIAGSQSHAILADEGAPLRVAGVQFDMNATENSGAIASLGRLIAEDVLAKNTAPTAQGVRALWASATSSASIARWVIEGSFDEPLIADGPTSIRARDVVIAVSPPDAHVVTAQGTIDLARAQLSGAGVHCTGPGRETLADVAIERGRVYSKAGCDVRATRLSIAGGSIELEESARVEATDLWLETSRIVAIEGSTIAISRAHSSAFGEDAVVITSGARGFFTDLALADGRGIDGPAIGGGIIVVSAGLELTRAVIDRVRGWSIVVRSAGTATISDVDIAQPIAGGARAGGVFVIEGARVTAARIQVREPAAPATGFAAIGGARIAGIDLAVESASEDDGADPAAFYAGDGALLDLTRVRVRGFPGTGIKLELSTATILDADLSDLRGVDGLDELSGLRLLGSTAIARRIRVARVDGSGVVAAGESTLTLEDARIRQIGRGVSLEESSATIARIVVEGATTRGIAAFQSQLQLADALLLDTSESRRAFDASGGSFTIARVRANTGAIVSDTNTGVHTLEDLLFEGAAGLTVDRVNEVNIARVAFRAVKDSGLHLKHETRADVRDLLIDSGGPIVGPASGLAVSSGASVNLTSFSLGTGFTIGIEVSSALGAPPTRLDAHNGTITGVDTAVTRAAPDGSIVDVQLHGVRLIDTDTTFGGD